MDYVSALSTFKGLVTVKTVSNLDEAVQDIVGAAIVAGTSIGVVYSDAAGTITISLLSHTHTASQVTDFAEAVDDRVAVLVVAGTGIGVVYSDAANTLTISLTGTLAHTHPAADIVSGTIATARLGTGTADATTFLRGDQTWAVPVGGAGGHTIKDEGTALTARAGLNFLGAGVTATDDAAGDETEVTIPGYTDEQAQDAVGAMAASSARVTLTYVDATPSLTPDLVANTITAGYLNATQTDIFFGRDTAAAGAGEEITMSAARTMLSINNVDNTSDLAKPVSTATQTAIDAAVVGLWDFKGVTDASTNPNYPAASKGDTYKISVAGKIGGASGKVVSVGDVVIASADNAGGTEAAVGTSWFVLEANVPGITTVGNSFITLTNPSAVTFPRMNADNTVTALSASDFRTAIGAGTSSFSGAFADLTGKPTTLAGYGITDAQPLDVTLTALAAYNTNGLLTQTAADTFAGRTLTGTTNQITVTNGDGVSGNPTLSLPADVLIPTVLTLPNTGLHILDTNGTHDLIIAAGSNLTADRTLTVTTGDANRTLTIDADTTLGGGSHSGTNTGDQSAASILASLLTVDGTGSGLDADMLDGSSSAAFAAASHTHTLADITDDGTMAAQNASAVTITGGTINGTTVGASTPAAGTFTALQATGNLTVNGDLLVSGATVTMNTATMEVEDPLIKLAKGNAADAVDLGFYALYRPASTDLHTGLFRDATDGIWKLFQGLEPEPTTTVNTGGAGYALATLAANITAGSFNGGAVTGSTGAFTSISVGGGTALFTGGLNVSSGSITLSGPLSTTDSLPLLASANGSDALDIGFYGRYQPASTALYCGLFRDASDGKFHLFAGLQEAPTTDVVNKSGTGYTVATLVANLEGNASTVTTNANLTGVVTSVGNATSFAASPAFTGTPTAPTAAVGTNTTQIATTAYVVAAIREKLTAARTYYVRTDGSDSNDGLADSAGGAFLTIQKAIDTVAALDIGTHAVTIDVGDGTYTGGVSVSGSWIGSGTVTLQGDTTTPANVVISKTSGDCIAVSNPGSRLTVKGFKLTTTTSGHCIAARYGAFVTVNGKCDFGAASGQFHMYATQHAHISIAGVAYNITGSAAAHLYVDIMGSILSQSASPTLTGTPAFSSQFAHADALGILYSTGMTFSGSATGTRYSATTNSVINAGGGASYFPGNAAGSVATGGQYV